MASPTVANCGVTVAELHPVDTAAHDLPYGYTESVDSSGVRSVFEWQTSDSGAVFVRHRYAVEGKEIAPADEILSTDHPVKAFAHVATDGTVSTSWLELDTCRLAVAELDGAGAIAAQASFPLAEDLCDSGRRTPYDVFPMYPAPGGSWYFLEHVYAEYSSESAIRIFRYDVSGAEKAHVVTVLHEEPASYADLLSFAFDDDGSLVNAWTDTPAGTSVYARIYGPDGMPRSPQLELGHVTEYRLGDLQIVVNAPGTAVVAWNWGSGGKEIVVADDVATTSTTTTTLVGGVEPPYLGASTPIELGPLFLWYYDHAQLASDGNGVWVVAWSSWHLMVDASFDDGRSWNGPRIIGDGWGPAIASAPGGRWMVTASSGEGWGFWRSADNARTWQSDSDPWRNGSSDYLEHPYNDGSYAAYGTPALFSPGDGKWTFAVAAHPFVRDFHEFWTSIFVASSDDDAASWSGADPFADELRNPREWATTAIVGRDEQDPLVLWKLWTLRGFSPSNGDGSSEPATLTPAWSEPGTSWIHPDGFSVASGGDGTIVAVWASRSRVAGGTGLDSDILVSRSGDAGTTWSEPAPIESRAYGDRRSDDQPHIATNGHGEWLVLWRSTDPAFAAPGRYAFVASISVDDGQTWSAPAPRTPGDVGSWEMMRLESLVADPPDSWAALWVTWTGATESGRGWVQKVERPSSCGNGSVDAFETCDDGNLVDGDGCDSNCRPTGCGNGVVMDGEQCDDGNDFDYDSCLSSCLPARCGDGVERWDTEECDDGNSDDDDSCHACEDSECGDGLLWSMIEECDDGNRDDGDGCDGNCTPTGCGNGVRTIGEDCDDGNTRDDDGCPNTCKPATCGDGILRKVYDEWWDDEKEQCDDGNTSNHDGCIWGCRLNTCRDGFVNPATEQCDDGNPHDGDGCDYNCTRSACGNGITAPAELCDDGNTAGGDWCSADCNSFSDYCGDANGDHSVTAVDAARVLRTSVGLPPACPRWTCDVDTSGSITAGDGLLVLRKAVGLELTSACQSLVHLHVTAEAPTAFVQITVGVSERKGVFREALDDRPRCFRSSGDAVTAGGWPATAVVPLATGSPRLDETVTCQIRRLAPMLPSDFYTDVSAFDSRLEPVAASIELQLD